MAFTQPRQWAFQDTVPQADLQKYSDNLTHFLTQHPVGSVMNDGRTGDTHYEYVSHVRCHRWLVYRPDEDDAKPAIRSMRDTDNADYTIALEGADVKDYYFDLDAVGWLVEGTAYWVSEVAYAYEVELENVN